MLVLHDWNLNWQMRIQIYVCIAWLWCSLYIYKLRHTWPLTNTRMSDFSDKEDCLLVHIMLKYTSMKVPRVPWKTIAKEIGFHNKSPEQIRLRFVQLKRRFGNDVTRFPRWFFVKRTSTHTCKMPSQALSNTVKEVTAEQSTPIELPSRNVDQEPHEASKARLIEAFIKKTTVRTMYWSILRY